MKRIYLLAIAVLLLPAISHAQFSLSNADHTFEMGGNFISGYQYEFYPKGSTDIHNTAFILDQARLNFRGRIGNQLQYKFEVDFADLGLDIQAPSPELGFLKDAYVEYKTPIVNIKTGYQKVAYGYSSLMEEIDEPFLKRPYLVTKLNSRRDVGVTLIHEFPIQGLNLKGGIYSGMGEQVFSTENTTGRPEYVGRIEYAFPAKYQLEKIDWRMSPVPIFQCGINARYANEGITAGKDYSLLIVDGKKTSYGADASVFYKGFTLMVEAHQLHVVPNDSTRLHAEGTTYKYFKAGGYIAELDYYAKCIKSVFGIRYDELNPSDLTYGDTQRTIGYCYNYMIKQNFLSIKAEYDHHLPTSYQGIYWNNDDFYLELQFVFN